MLGIQYSFNLVIFTMTSALSLTTPLIVPFGALFFGVKYLIDKYNLLYGYRPVYVSGRQYLHKSAMKLVMVGVVFVQFVTLFYSIVREGENMHVTCTSHVHHMYITCTSHVYHMYITCTSHVHHMYITCTSHVYHMYITCTSHVYHMYITCTSHVHHMFITCISHVYHMYITCTSHVKSTMYTCM